MLGLVLDHVTLGKSGGDFRAAVFLDAVRDADLTGLRVTSKGEKPTIVQRGSTGVRDSTGSRA